MGPMNLSFMTILPSVSYIVSGVIVTLQYTIVSVFFGLCIGILLALFKIPPIEPLKEKSISKIFRLLANLYTSLFRGTPLILQLTILYYATPQLTNHQISAFAAGILAFSLNSGAYISEIIRSGILSIDRGQTEAALSLGVSNLKTKMYIIFPQAIKNILPALANEMIDLLKESALVSTIGEADLLRRAHIVATTHYMYFEPLLIAGACYYLLVLILTYGTKRLEKRLRNSDRH